MTKAPLGANIRSDTMGRNKPAPKYAKKAISFDGRLVGADLTFAERALREETASSFAHGIRQSLQ